MIASARAICARAMSRSARALSTSISDAARLALARVKRSSMLSASAS
jgi:hypothetical protein